jgi:Flp pilus assembly protein TadB
MIRDLFSGMTAREQRAFRWSAAAAVAALWLSMAWTDPWVLLTLPLIAGGCFVVVRKMRREESEEDDEAEWGL